MKSVPLVGLLAAYALGVAFRIQRPILEPSLLAVICGGVLALLLWALRWNRASYMFVCLLALLSGIWRVNLTDRTLAPAGEPPPRVDWRSEVYEGEVVSYPSITESGHRFRVRLNGRLASGSHDPSLSQSVAMLSLEGLEAPLKGETIRFRARLSAPRNLGNDREFNFERYCRCRDIDWVGSISSSSDWIRLPRAVDGWQRILNRIRAGAYETAQIYMGPERVSLFLSLVLGDMGGVSRDQSEAFRRAGIIHLLVVSGLHVVMAAGVVAILFLELARFFPWLLLRVPIWHLRAVSGMGGAVLFCLLTDLPVPTLRALLAALLILAATFLYRPQSGWNALCVVAFALLTYRPLWLADVSFQLSILAVVGILFASTLTSRWLKGIPKHHRGRRYLVTALAVSTGASLCTTPAILWHFGQLALWSIPSNLVFVPTVGGVSVPLGMAATLLSSVWPGLAGFLFCLLDRWLEVWMPCIDVVSKWPGSSLVFSSPPATALAAYTLLLMILGLRLTGRLRGSRAVVISTGLAIAVGALPYLPLDRPETELHFLHVGQGDATFLRTSDRRTMMVDAGPGGSHGFDAGERVLLPWLRVHGYRRIDVLAITHDDADHSGGAAALLGGIEIGEIWGPKLHSSKGMAELVRIARDRQIPWRTVERSDRPIVWGDTMIRVLHPGVGDPPFPHPDNNSSLVLRIEVASFSALLTGDLEKEGEGWLLKSGGALRTTLLKVGHHGSRTSTSEPFLRIVSPRFALISSGWRNRYHHPAPSVLRRLDRHGVRTWRGDECGEVAFRVGSGSHSARTVRDCRNRL